jgi:hypothetical protein
VALAPEPSGGVVLKIAHEKLPFTMWIPLEKDRADQFEQAIKEIRGKHLASVTNEDVNRFG